MSALHKISYLALAFTFVFAGTTVHAQWISNPNNTTVQSASPLYSLTMEYTWDGGGNDYLPQSFIRTVCNNGSCYSTSGAYNILDFFTHYDTSCGTAATAAGFSSDDAYTCSQNSASFWWYCTNDNNLGTYCGKGSGGEMGGAGSIRGGAFKTKEIVEVFSGVQAASGPCKAFPSEWNTQSPYVPTYTYMDTYYDKLARATECTTSTNAGTAVPSNTCQLPSGPSADAIIDECARSTSGGYTRGSDFDFAYVLTEDSASGFYRTCQNNQFIAQGMCSNGEFVWDGDPSCQGSYPVCTNVPQNTPPSIPVIAGPTTGAVNTSYGFAFTASDPDSDTLRYGITDASCANVTEWLPGAGYVNSATGQTKNQTWSAATTHTFYVLAEDSKGARSGCASHTITVAPAPPTTVDLKVNGSDGPVTLSAPGNVTVSWTATNAASCNLYGPTFGGTGVPLIGSGSATVNNTDNFVLICNGVSDQVVVNVTPPPPPPPNFIPPTFYNISYNNFNQATNEYGNITATMRVSNYGGSATGGSAPYEVRLDGAQKANGSIPPLVQNGYVDIAVTVPGPITVGSHTLTGEADKGNLIAESNENDNTGDYPITIPSLDPGLSITANPNRVQNNQNSNISWTVANPYSMNCSVFGPGMATVNFNPATNGASGNANVGPITAKSEYTISCTSAGTTFTAKTTIETQGVIEEI